MCLSDEVRRRRRNGFRIFFFSSLFSLIQYCLRRIFFFREGRGGKNPCRKKPRNQEILVGSGDERRRDGEDKSEMIHLSENPDVGWGRGDGIFNSRAVMIPLISGSGIGIAIWKMSRSRS